MKLVWSLKCLAGLKRFSNYRTYNLENYTHVVCFCILCSVYKLFVDTLKQKDAFVKGEGGEDDLLQDDGVQSLELPVGRWICRSWSQSGGRWGACLGTALREAWREQQTTLSKHFQGQRGTRRANKISTRSKFQAALCKGKKTCSHALIVYIAIIFGGIPWSCHRTQWCVEALGWCAEPQLHLPNDSLMRWVGTAAAGYHMHDRRATFSQTCKLAKIRWQRCRCQWDAMGTKWYKENQIPIESNIYATHPMGKGWSKGLTKLAEGLLQRPWSPSSKPTRLSRALELEIGSMSLCDACRLLALATSDAAWGCMSGCQADRWIKSTRLHCFRGPTTFNKATWRDGWQIQVSQPTQSPLQEPIQKTRFSLQK